MSDQAIKDDAAKQRIITHMNADHHDSIIRYLEHYHQVPSYTAFNGKLTDVTMSQLTFACGGKTYETPLKPAMTSFREARERLVDMDKDCVAAMDRSDITIKSFPSLKGPNIAACVFIIFIFVTFSSRSNFATGGLIAGVVPDGFRRFCSFMQPFVFYFMLAMHSAETWHMSQGRLRKHNVNVRDPIYWKWMADCFVEGAGSYMRFDALVSLKRKEKERQKH